MASDSHNAHSFLPPSGGQKGPSSNYYDEPSDEEDYKPVYSRANQKMPPGTSYVVLPEVGNEVLQGHAFDLEALEDQVAELTTKVDNLDSMLEESMFAVDEGFVGNPSDGYYGACLSFATANHHAEVVAASSPTFRILPGPHDLEFPSMASFKAHVDQRGCYGGIRLLKAAAQRFLSLVASSRQRLREGTEEEVEGVAVEELIRRMAVTEAVSLSYATTIPPMVGLAGSSAIVLATMRALCGFYGIPLAALVAGGVYEVPTQVLFVEKSLGISAGLQDRVVQVLGGTVMMDFGVEQMQKYGHGAYEQMPSSWLPQPLFIVYAEPSFSGAVHADLRERWEEGDSEVLAAISELRGLAEESAKILREAEGKLSEAAVSRLCDVLDRNFDVRQTIMDVSESNAEMVRLVRSLGLACKFTGSGGAVVALPRPAVYPKGEEEVAGIEEKLKQLEEVGIKFERIRLE